MLELVLSTLDIPLLAWASVAGTLLVGCLLSEALLHRLRFGVLLVILLIFHTIHYPRPITLRCIRARIVLPGAIMVLPFEGLAGSLGCRAELRLIADRRVGGALLAAVELLNVVHLW